MNPVTVKFGPACFGASTFFAAAHPSESCGTNGLPLTPNSICILGKAHLLFSICHPHLCAYLDVVRTKHEQIIVIQEYYPLDITAAYGQYVSFRADSFLINLMHQVFQGLQHLNNFGSVSCNISPQNILITPMGQSKISAYGLFYMTEGGNSVSFPIGHPKYLPPELLVRACGNTTESDDGGTGGNPAWDTWSVGMVFLELFLGVEFFNGETIGTIVRNILELTAKHDTLASCLAELCGKQDRYQALSTELQDLLSKCLDTDPLSRPSPSTCLSHVVFANLPLPSHPSPICPQFPTVDSKLTLVEFSQYKRKLGISKENYVGGLPNYPYVGDLEDVPVQGAKWTFTNIDHLAERSIHEIYHLWLLVGGNPEQELKKQKVIHTKASILTVPSLVGKEGETFGGLFPSHDQLPSKSIVLPVHNLRKRLKDIPAHKYYPLITQGEPTMEGLESQNLPLVIRERDAEYQFHRIILFKRLLSAYPFKLDSIVQESRKDIPPFYRGLIWAALLRVDGDINSRYEKIDKDTLTATDRQIEVDIPRCHQYDPLLSSPEGHRKFTRILKAWVADNPRLVYWQGLDSLCAPFLYLNFTNEALAFACLSEFISRYLRNFFLQDNSPVIQEYLAKFSHIIAFHDPQLFNHLYNIGFVPELYAIPWFLTMFTHVFPLHKIFLLWDTLLLGESSLPLCVGLAVLWQLKDRLLQFGFNECILLFSDMPDINMERVVKDAINVFCTTPRSLTYRKYSSENADKEDAVREGKSDRYKETGNENYDIMMSELPLSTLKEELVGRVAGAEVLELMAKREGGGGTKSKVVLLDVRSSEDFGKGSLPGAISIPSEVCFGDEDEFLLPTLYEDLLHSFKGKVVVAFGSESSHQQVLKVAHALLNYGQARICTLHKGIHVFRSSGHLIVTSP